ncbi:hypothetical protein KEM52_005859, partial [Ascosphaera acerosa]
MNQYQQKEDVIKKRKLRFYHRKLSRLMVPLYKEAFRPRSHPFFAMKIGASLALSVLAYRYYAATRDAALSQ